MSSAHQVGQPPRGLYTVQNNKIYTVSNNARQNELGSLVDRGANGGILGSDARVILTHTRKVDVRGIDNHEMPSLKIVDAGARVETNKGPVVLILRQYAYTGRGRTIHSSGQIEHYKNHVDDKSMRVGGKQRILTNDGYVIPLDIIQGLPYMKMQPHTDKELKDLPHVILTSGAPWDPTVLDNTISDKNDWYNTVKDYEEEVINSPFDEFGNYRNREPVAGPAEGHADGTVAELRACFHQLLHVNDRYIVDEHNVKPSPINYESYRPYFLGVSTEKVKKTFENTTQWATNVMAGGKIRNTIQSPYPACNIHRRHEPVATDTIYAEVPAVDTGGQKNAQVFVGRKSLVVDIYGMKSDKEFVNTLEDVIRHRGAMDKLISDGARTEMNKRVLEILRALFIDDWQSEPKYQHQNFAERRWGNAKASVDWLMNTRNVQPNAWLLCACYVAFIMNHTAEKSLGWRTPMEVLTGQRSDISILLLFLFWDIVYIKRYKDAHYSGQIGSEETSEVRGRFVGFAEHCGHALTFLVLTDDTQKVVPRSRIRLATEEERNLRLDTLAGDVKPKVFIKSARDENKPMPTIDLENSPFTVETVEEEEDVAEDRKDDTGNEDAESQPQGRSPMDSVPLRQAPVVETVDEENDPDYMHLRKPGEPNPNQEAVDFILDKLRTENATEERKLTPEEMIGRTFLMPPGKDGSRDRAIIQERIAASRDELKKDPEYIKFRVRVGDKFDEIVAYNDIYDYIEADETWDGLWRFKEILDHEGPLNPGHKNYKGSRYNLLLLWETGEKTWEPLITNNGKEGVYVTDRVTVAIYARKHNLLDTPGWKLPGLKKLMKTQKRMIRSANQAKLHSFRTKPIYMYGFLVPRNHDQAMHLDRENGNTRWRDAELLELKQIDEYETFDDKGRGYNPGQGWKKINVHFVYACKHDGRHKARLVAGGHLTDTPIDSVYSSVVSLRGIRIISFIAELNGLEFWSTDIGNAYLESKTKEKVFIVAGPEFGDRAGHTLIIVRALYGLKSSGLRWWERFADVLRGMGFFPSKAERDIWMRRVDDHYEYIATYVDDLGIASKNPQAIVDELESKHKFKLKGTGPIHFHLGCDYFRDKDGVLCYAPKKYVDKMLDNFVRHFGHKPKPYTSPLEPGDHPETDDSELLNMEGIKLYQSLIGSLQWAVQIGRMDITTAVMTMSRFRAAPRRGHLERVKRIFGYLHKMRHATVRIRTTEPDHSAVPVKHYDWEYTAYAGAEEVIPKDAPIPLGLRVLFTTYVDANLYHDLISGKSVTGIIHLANQTPVDWFSKLQSTVETATFGSEYVAARTASEQIMDLRLTFRYLGVPVHGATLMFGDNETVVNTASIPHSRLVKRHNALSYHYVRHGIAAGAIRFHHMRGEDNPADILSKHWGYQKVWSQLKPLLFWEGDTAQLLKKSEDESSS